MSFGMKALDYLDFNSPYTPRNQVKVQYAATIAARLAACRSKEETRETMTRDIPGFFALLYIANIVEKSVGFLLDKISSASKQGMSLIKGPEAAKSFIQMLNPFGSHKVRSFEDIEAVKNIIKPENFKELMRNKAIVFIVGLASSIALLGLFIPWLNVQITRKEVLEKQKKSHPKVNMTPDPGFKPNGANLSRLL